MTDRLPPPLPDDDRPAEPPIDASGRRAVRDAVRRWPEVDPSTREAQLRAAMTAYDHSGLTRPGSGAAEHGAHRSRRRLVTAVAAAAIVLLSVGAMSVRFLDNGDTDTLADGVTTTTAPMLQNEESSDAARAPDTAGVRSTTTTPGDLRSNADVDAGTSSAAAGAPESFSAEQGSVDEFIGNATDDPSRLLQQPHDGVTQSLIDSCELSLADQRFGPQWIAADRGTTDIIVDGLLTRVYWRQTDDRVVAVATLDSRCVFELRP